MRRFEGVDGFLDAAGAFLTSDEARNTLLFAIVDTLLTRPELAERRPYLAAVERDGEVAGAVAMLPPNPLVVSPLTPAEALPLVADDLLADARAEQVTDMSSPPEVVEPFLALWAERTGRSGRVVMEERLHRIDSAPDVPAVAGQFRMATLDDLELLTDWTLAFQAEAWRGGMTIDRELLRSNVRARVEGRGGGAGVWVDGGEPVAMASYFSSGPPKAVRVAPVYTPPALRGRGYGTAVTAATTRTAFELGHRLCVLFTDIHNPTSNHIYAQIGYRPVSEWVHAKVQAAGAM